MTPEKRKQLEEELAKYQKKLVDLVELAATSRGGSRYGDEFMEVQVKVYQDMVNSIKRELAKK